MEYKALKTVNITVPKEVVMSYKEVAEKTLSNEFGVVPSINYDVLNQPDGVQKLMDQIYEWQQARYDECSVMYIICDMALRYLQEKEEQNGSSEKM